MTIIFVCFKKVGKLSFCFIIWFRFQKTWAYLFYTKAKTFFHQESFPLAKIFFLIKKISHKPRFFFDQEVFYKQESFPRAKIFHWSRKFSTNKKVFHNQKLFIDQGSFPQTRFFISQDFSLIKEVFCKQRFFLHQRSFFQRQKYFSKQSFYIYIVLIILTCLMVKNMYSTIISFCIISV